MLRTSIIKVLIFVASLYNCNHLILVKIKKNSLAFEDYKRKANCEGDKFSPIFPVGDHTISAKKGDIVNDDNMVKEYFGSDPKEEEI